MKFHKGFTYMMIAAFVQQTLILPEVWASETLRPNDTAVTTTERTAAQVAQSAQNQNAFVDTLNALAGMVHGVSGMVQTPTSMSNVAAPVLPASPASITPVFTPAAGVTPAPANNPTTALAVPAAPAGSAAVTPANPVGTPQGAVASNSVNSTGIADASIPPRTLPDYLKSGRPSYRVNLVVDASLGGSGQYYLIQTSASGALSVNINATSYTGVLMDFERNPSSNLSRILDEADAQALYFGNLSKSDPKQVWITVKDKKTGKEVCYLQIDRQTGNILSKLTWKTGNPPISSVIFYSEPVRGKSTAKYAVAKSYSSITYNTASAMDRKRVITLKEFYYQRVTTASNAIGIASVGNYTRVETQNTSDAARSSIKESFVLNGGVYSGLGVSAMSASREEFPNLVSPVSNKTFSLSMTEQTADGSVVYSDTSIGNETARYDGLFGALKQLGAGLNKDLSDSAASASQSEAAGRAKVGIFVLQMKEAAVYKKTTFMTRNPYYYGRSFVLYSAKADGVFVDKYVTFGALTYVLPVGVDFERAITQGLRVSSYPSVGGYTLSFGNYYRTLATVRTSPSQSVNLGAIYVTAPSLILQKNNTNGRGEVILVDLAKSPYAKLVVNGAEVWYKFTVVSGVIRATLANPNEIPFSGTNTPFELVAESNGATSAKSFELQVQNNANGSKDVRLKDASGVMMIGSKITNAQDLADFKKYQGTSLAVDSSWVFKSALGTESYFVTLGATGEIAAVTSIARYPSQTLAQTFLPTQTSSGSRLLGKYEHWTAFQTVIESVVIYEEGSAKPLTRIGITYTGTQAAHVIIKHYAGSKIETTFSVEYSRIDSVLRLATRGELSSGDVDRLLTVAPQWYDRYQINGKEIFVLNDWQDGKVAARFAFTREGQGSFRIFKVRGQADGVSGEADDAEIRLGQVANGYEVFALAGVPTPGGLIFKKDGKFYRSDPLLSKVTLERYKNYDITINDAGEISLTFSAVQNPPLMLTPGFSIQGGLGITNMPFMLSSVSSSNFFFSLNGTTSSLTRVNPTDAGHASFFEFIHTNPLSQSVFGEQNIPSDEVIWLYHAASQKYYRWDGYGAQWLGEVRVQSPGVYEVISYVSALNNVYLTRRSGTLDTNAGTGSYSQYHWYRTTAPSFTRNMMTQTTSLNVVGGKAVETGTYYAVDMSSGAISPLFSNVQNTSFKSISFSLNTAAGGTQVSTAAVEVYQTGRNSSKIDVYSLPFESGSFQSDSLIMSFVNRLKELARVSMTSLASNPDSRVITLEADVLKLLRDLESASTVSVITNAENRVIVREKSAGQWVAKTWQHPTTGRVYWVKNSMDPMSAPVDDAWVIQGQTVNGYRVEFGRGSGITSGRLMFAKEGKLYLSDFGGNGVKLGDGLEYGVTYKTDGSITLALDPKMLVGIREQSSAVMREIQQAHTNLTASLIALREAVSQIRSLREAQLILAESEEIHALIASLSPDPALTQAADDLFAVAVETVKLFGEGIEDSVISRLQERVQNLIREADASKAEAESLRQAIDRAVVVEPAISDLQKLISIKGLFDAGYTDRKRAMELDSERIKADRTVAYDTLTRTRQGLQDILDSDALQGEIRRVLAAAREEAKGVLSEVIQFYEGMFPKLKALAELADGIYSYEDAKKVLDELEAVRVEIWGLNPGTKVGQEVLWHRFYAKAAVDKFFGSGPLDAALPALKESIKTLADKLEKIAADARDLEDKISKERSVGKARTYLEALKGLPGLFQGITDGHKDLEPKAIKLRSDRKEGYETASGYLVKSKEILKIQKILAPIRRQGYAAMTAIYKVRGEVSLHINAAYELTKTTHAYNHANHFLQEEEIQVKVERFLASIRELDALDGLYSDDSIRRNADALRGIVRDASVAFSGPEEPYFSGRDAAFDSLNYLRPYAIAQASRDSMASAEDFMNKLWNDAVVEDAEAHLAGILAIQTLFEGTYKPNGASLENDAETTKKGRDSAYDAVVKAEEDLKAIIDAAKVEIKVKQDREKLAAIKDQTPGILKSIEDEHRLALAWANGFLAAIQTVKTFDQMKTLMTSAQNLYNQFLALNPPVDLKEVADASIRIIQDASMLFGNGPLDSALQTIRSRVEQFIRDADKWRADARVMAAAVAADADIVAAQQHFDGLNAAGKALHDAYQGTRTDAEKLKADRAQAYRDADAAKKRLEAIYAQIGPFTVTAMLVTDDPFTSQGIPYSLSVNGSEITLSIGARLWQGGRKVDPAELTASSLAGLDRLIQEGGSVYAFSIYTYEPDIYSAQVWTTLYVTLNAAKKIVRLLTVATNQPAGVVNPQSVVNFWEFEPRTQGSGTLKKSWSRYLFFNNNANSMAKTSETYFYSAQGALQYSESIYTRMYTTRASRKFYQLNTDGSREIISLEPLPGGRSISWRQITDGGRSSQTLTVPEYAIPSNTYYAYNLARIQEWGFETAWNELKAITLQNAVTMEKTKSDGTKVFYRKGLRPATPQEFVAFQAEITVSGGGRLQVIVRGAGFDGDTGERDDIVLFENQGNITIGPDSYSFKFGYQQNLEWYYLTGQTTYDMGVGIWTNGGGLGKWTLLRISGPDAPLDNLNVTLSGKTYKFKFESYASLKSYFGSFPFEGSLSAPTLERSDVYSNEQWEFQFTDTTSWSTRRSPRINRAFTGPDGYIEMTTYPKTKTDGSSGRVSGVRWSPSSGYSESNVMALSERYYSDLINQDLCALYDQNRIASMGSRAFWADLNASVQQWMVLREVLGRTYRHDLGDYTTDFFVYGSRNAAGNFVSRLAVKPGVGSVIVRGQGADWANGESDDIAFDEVQTVSGFKMRYGLYDASLGAVDMNLWPPTNAVKGIGLVLESVSDPSVRVVADFPQSNLVYVAGQVYTLAVENKRWVMSPALIVNDRSLRTSEVRVLSSGYNTPEKVEKMNFLTSPEGVVSLSFDVTINGQAVNPAPVTGRAVTLQSLTAQYDPNEYPGLFESDSFSYALVFDNVPRPYEFFNGSRWQTGTSKFVLLFDSNRKMRAVIEISTQSETYGYTSPIAKYFFTSASSSGGDRLLTKRLIFQTIAATATEPKSVDRQTILYGYEADIRPGTYRMTSFVNTQESYPRREGSARTEYKSYVSYNRTTGEPLGSVTVRRYSIYSAGRFAAIGWDYAITAANNPSHLRTGSILESRIGGVLRSADWKFSNISSWQAGLDYL